jgi:hypothetical protein
MYSSTRFGRSHAHHQELNKCSSSLWFYRWSVVVAVLLVVVGPVVITGPTTTNSSKIMHGFANLKFLKMSNKLSIL